MSPATPVASNRFELTLRRPRLPWHPKPTVVFNGRGQPAQWGTGTWRYPEGGNLTVSVYLHNRMWTYGSARATLDPDHPAALVYSAPVLPFMSGRLRSVPQLTAHS
ncbi:hypothetical protein [Rathayibacter soli]|uniref:hypothetical protein n=1 Tax=Rathayibacter soli TaxID=3144168 RepID=UPI0027E53EE9|nr:hypothetical protein [Glaciibacter superstes]